jgi:glutaredoxin-related protein
VEPRAASAAPQCGFSNTCVQVLNNCAVPYETVNILEDDALRTGAPAQARWLRATADARSSAP